MDLLPKSLKLSSENFNSFLAVVGLLVLVSSLVLPHLVSRNLVEELITFQGQQDLNQSKIEHCMDQIESLAVEIDHYKEMMDSLRSQSLTGQELAELKAATEQMQAKAGEMRAEREELELMRIEMATNLDLIGYHYRELRILQALSLLGGFLGTVMLLIGFRLWRNQQRYRDEILRNQAATERSATTDQEH